VTTCPPPDPCRCWEGTWTEVTGPLSLWLLAAVVRTVATLPRLHPWRLGDAKGTGRVLQWTAAATDVSRPTYGLLAMTQRDPQLPTGDEEEGSLAQASWSVLSEAVQSEPAPPPRWAGVVCALSDVWLPPLAILPTSLKGWDDPQTGWATESVDFDAAHRVYSSDLHYAADVLAPHVMALITDAIPRGSSVTIAGDALHVWWPYTAPFDDEPGRVARAAAAAAALTDAVPGFVLHQYPDHSHVIEDELAQRRADAERYQRQRQPGHSSDPVLERIYQGARDAAGLRD